MFGKDVLCDEYDGCEEGVEDVEELVVELVFVVGVGEYDFNGERDE